MSYQKKLLRSDEPWESSSSLEGECACLPSYVVITILGSSANRSTRFFTLQLSIVHR
ncbi:hypothetical protein LguiA_003861 [Lonicera macranthoides]